MPISYKLPKIENIDKISVLETPVAATDVTLASGLLTVLDEAGNVAIQVKTSDILSFSYDAYTPGTANVRTVNLSSVVMSDTFEYSLTVSSPYVVNFFAGGQETGAIFKTRTYTVSVPTIPPAVLPDVDQLGAAFVARIAADANAFFTASYSTATNILTITALSPLAGPLEIKAPVGAVVLNPTPWVEPVGTTSEVLGYVNNPAIVQGPSYNRYVIRYRKFIRQNSVLGLQVGKPVNSLVYLDSVDAGTAATVTKLTSILNGSFTPVSAYLGSPSI